MRVAPRFSARSATTASIPPSMRATEPPTKSQSFQAMKRLYVDAVALNTNVPPLQPKLQSESLCRPLFLASIAPFSWLSIRDWHS